MILSFLPFFLGFLQLSLCFDDGLCEAFLTPIPLSQFSFQSEIVHGWEKLILCGILYSGNHFSNLVPYQFSLPRLKRMFTNVSGGEGEAVFNFNYYMSSFSTIQTRFVIANNTYSNNNNNNNGNESIINAFITLDLLNYLNWTSPRTYFSFNATEECAQHSTGNSLELYEIPLAKAATSNLSFFIHFRDINVLNRTNNVSLISILFTNFEISSIYKGAFPCFQLSSGSKFLPLVNLQNFPSIHQNTNTTIDKKEKEKENDKYFYHNKNILLENRKRHGSKDDHQKSLIIYHFKDLNNYLPDQIFGNISPIKTYEFSCKIDINYTVLRNITGIENISKDFFSIGIVIFYYII
jgi:hypothetical protein